MKFRKRPIVTEARRAEVRPEFRFPKDTAVVSPTNWVVTEVVWSRTYSWTPGTSEARYGPVLNIKETNT